MKCVRWSKNLTYMYVSSVKHWSVLMKCISKPSVKNDHIFVYNWTGLSGIEILRIRHNTLNSSLFFTSFFFIWCAFLKCELSALLLKEDDNSEKEKEPEGETMFAFVWMDLGAMIRGKKKEILFLISGRFWRYFSYYSHSLSLSLSLFLSLPLSLSFSLSLSLARFLSLSLSLSLSLFLSLSLSSFLSLSLSLSLPLSLSLSLSLSPSLAFFLSLSLSPSLA